MPETYYQKQKRIEVLNDLVTARQAAINKGVAESTIRRAVREGRLPGQKIGPVYMVSMTAVENWTPLGHRQKKRRNKMPWHAEPA